MSYFLRKPVPFTQYKTLDSEHVLEIKRWPYQVICARIERKTREEVFLDEKVS